MKQAMLNVLQADADLNALLTGGIHGVVEINRRKTPTAFDSGNELLPCALLKQISAVPDGPYNTSQRVILSLIMYQLNNHAIIEQARHRAYALLNQQRLTPINGGGGWLIEHNNDILDTYDDALNAYMIVSRFRAWVNRI